MRDLVVIAGAELRKLARRPGAWTLLGAAVLLSQSFGYLVPYLSYRSGSTGELTAGSTVDELLAATLPAQVITNTTAAFPVFTGALAFVLGALVTGSEYSGGTVKTLLTQGPRRRTVFLGQTIAAILAVAVGIGLLFGTCAFSSWLIAAVENRPQDWPALADLARGLGAGWAVMAMWTTLGAFLGILLRSVALPIGLGVVWILGVENLLSAVASTSLTALRPLRDALPGVNAGSLISAVLPDVPGDLPPGVQTTVSGGHGLLVVTLYLLAAAGVLVTVTSRRDVT